MIIGLVSICAPAFESSSDIPRELLIFMEFIAMKCGKYPELFRHPYENNFHWADTNSGWWNLNQEWVEFYADVRTSWGNCVLLDLSPDEQDTFEKYLKSGQLVATLRYIVPGDTVGEFTLTPHC